MAFMDKFLADKDLVFTTKVPREFQIGGSHDSDRVDACVFRRLTNDHIIVGLFTKHSDAYYGFYASDPPTYINENVALRLYNANGDCLSVASKSACLYRENIRGVRYETEIYPYIECDFSEKALTFGKTTSLALIPVDGRKKLAEANLTIPGEIWQQHIIWDKKRQRIALSDEEQIIEKALIKKENEEKALKKNLASALEISEKNIAGYVKKTLVGNYSVVKLLYHPPENPTRKEHYGADCDLEGAVGGYTVTLSGAVRPYLILMSGDKIISYKEGETRFHAKQGLLPDTPLNLDESSIIIDKDKGELRISSGHSSIFSDPSAKLKIPAEILKEMNLAENMASENPNRKELRGHITRIHGEEQKVREEVKKRIRSLAPEKEDPESPRYKRAQELKEQKRKYGSRAAIEVGKALKAQDDLGNQERKGLRRKIYERTQEAEALKAKRVSVSKKLLETIPEERKKEAERIHGLRRDIETRQRDLEKAQEELQKAQETYGDLRKRFRPKPKPVQPKPQPQPVQSTPKPAPRSFWSRLFGRGSNGGNG